MDYSELEILLKTNTPEENHILKSLNLLNNVFLTSDDTFYILSPIIHGSIENNILILDDATLLLPGENLAISKHHRYIKIPNHRHNFIELIYVYSGTCTQLINNSNIILKTGEMCILDTNTIHSIEAVNKNDIIINCLMRTDYFDTSFFSRLSSNDLISNFLVTAIYEKKKNNNYIVFHSSNNVKIMALMQDLMCEYFDNSICSKEIIDCYIVLIFSELLKLYKKQAEESTSSTKKSFISNVSEILKFIEDNYMDLTLPYTAEKFHFHPNYLSSLLKKTTGKSFKDIIHEQKLKKACSLLKNTDKTIDTIALEVGFNNLNFFYKKFKTAYDVTPSKYRRISKS